MKLAIAASALVVLLAVLATLQYRWVGDVSAAQRVQMLTTLRTRVGDFADAFDRELSRGYVAFHLDPSRFAGDPAAAIRDEWAQWQSSSAAPEMIRAVYLVDPRSEPVLRRFDPARGSLDAVEWPAPLAAWRGRRHPGDVPPLPEPVDTSIPALVVPQAVVADLDDGGQLTIVKAQRSMPLLILMLDADVLRRQILEPLAAKYFDPSQYVVSIVRRDQPDAVVYKSENAAVVGEREADASAALFDLRLDEMARFASPLALNHQGAQTKMAITIVRRGPGRGLITGSSSGGWQVRARYRGGSLDAIVEQSRRRNLAVGLGVLGLLAASLVLIVVSTQRQQRLARQQIEFVAGVSHELRTPVAVIRSAAENLADGVVADPDQVRRYGSLIGGESRRLSEMVERVLQYAGADGRMSRARDEVDPAGIVEEAAAGVRAEESAADIVVHADAVPRVVADREALRSAFQNVIANAVKYSRSGERVDVDVGARADRVRVAVADRGIGIDSDEIPHVFDPFFRGRRAIDAQIRGTGIGLSIVRQVIQAHHGSVRVDSREGGGTTVTIELPA